VAALLGLAAGAVLTGVLHLDGLADTADAFGASTRERALEIMRDHAVGAYGTVALVLDLGLKAAALSVLATRHDAVRYAVCATAAARAVPVVLSSVLPYARAAGTGGALGGTGPVRVAIAVAITVALAVVLHAPVTLAAAAAVALVAGVAARRALGGITGDILGAAAELCEVSALVAGVAIT
jgi:adenosylcobinamide-GDP ribazoletransferase